MTKNANLIGLFTGSLLAILHFLWAFLILIGVAQGLMDSIMSLHMMEMTGTKIGEFSFSKSVGLVLFTGVFGYVLGFLATVLFNSINSCCQKK